MCTITATELKKSLGRILTMVSNGETVIVTKGGESILEMRPTKPSKLQIFNSLIGIAKGVDSEAAKEERLAQK